MKIVRGFLLSALFAVANPAPMTAQRVAEASQTTPAFAYCFDFSGIFIRINVGQPAVSELWALPLVEGLGKSLPAYIPAGSNSAAGVWSAGPWRADSRAGRLYGVFPTKESDGEDGSYQILRLTLPRFELVGRTGLPLTSGRPTILLTPDAEQLFVSYTPRPDGAARPVVRVVDVYEAATLQKIRSIRETVELGKGAARAGAAFSERASFSKDGALIYDGLSKVSVGTEQMTRKTVRWMPLLSPEQRDKLRPFEQLNQAIGKPWLPFRFSESVDGVGLVIFYHDARSAILSLDLTNERVLSLSDGPAARAVVLPGGKRALCEEIEWRADSPGGQTRGYKTGRFFILDVYSGKRVEEFSAPELAGYEQDHKVLAVAESGSKAVYLAGGNLYVMTLQPNHRSIARIQSDFAASAWTECVFANR
jgi:hypothetical protein